MSSLFRSLSFWLILAGVLGIGYVFSGIPGGEPGPIVLMGFGSVCLIGAGLMALLFHKLLPGIPSAARYVMAIIISPVICYALLILYWLLVGRLVG